MSEENEDNSGTIKGILIFILIFGVGNAILYATTGHLIIPLK